ncbi:hypothetical protein HK098_004731 [Nowakowskiella sp. JEL0407]|nr:hypothetical protein HK098_004731 [Nowakowskiella sp. JEL0407]
MSNTTTTTITSLQLPADSSLLNSSASGKHSRRSTNSMFQPLDEEREVLVSRALDLQDSILGVIGKLEAAKEAHRTQATENQMLLKYINNLMAASGTNVSESGTKK